VIVANGNAALYSIELTTGRAIRLGGFDGMVVDLAIPLDQKP
jgi:hypothetical protein